MRRMKLWVSQELLGQLFHLPPDHRFVRAGVVQDTDRPHLFEFVVDGPLCPEIPSGGVLPLGNMEWIEGSPEAVLHW